MLKKIINLIFNSSLKQKKAFLKENLFTDPDENITRLVNIAKKTIKDYKDFLIIDIGAFDGKTSLAFSSAFPGNQILAFEANPDTFLIARNNCLHNKQIQIFNVAISNGANTSEFNITGNKVSSSLSPLSEDPCDLEEYHKELTVTSKISIETKSLDYYSKNKPILFIKIDVQGHELQVLEGATESLKNARYVLIEMCNNNIYKQGCKYHEIDKWLREHNYKLADIIVTYRKRGLFVSEFDAIYINLAQSHD